MAVPTVVISRFATLPGSRQLLHRALHHAAHLLPAQGPIGVFIHHNTLHAFQHLPFEDAVTAAAAVYGARPFMTEQAYREQFSEGRITSADISAVVSREENIRITDFLDRRVLRTEILSCGPRDFAPSAIQWHLDETDFLGAFRADLSPVAITKLTAGRKSAADSLQALFSACMDVRGPEKPPAIADSPLPNIAPHVIADEHIHPLLIRLCAAFVDQGMAYWSMPGREGGFLKAVQVLLSRRGAVLPGHFVKLAEEFRLQLEAGLEAEEVVLEMLYRLGITGDSFDAPILAELLELPGWAGIMYRLEQEPELAPHVRLKCSLIDYLAVRLTLKAIAAATLPVRPEVRRDAKLGTTILARAAFRFDCLQILGISGAELNAMSAQQRRYLVAEIDALNLAERTRLLHLAYEFNHETGILKPLANYRRINGIATSGTRPSAQVLFCIDEREESTRRHLEELAPDVETLGAAGFFGVAMDYAGIDDAHSVPLCPVVVKPQHEIRERAAHADSHLSSARSSRRKLWARAVRYFSVSSRTLIRGWAGTLVGLLALPLLLVRVLFPRQYGLLRDLLHRETVPQPRTTLDFSRTRTDASRSEAGLLQGFTVEEKIDRVAGLLGPAGLRGGFARLVVILGHGSTSLNNPHESAHDCGACGGRRGGPNARLFAALANHPAVRVGLCDRGISIPDDTWFVGGYHDTSNDLVELYDLQEVPATHREELNCLSRQLDRARALDAQERARRFEAASPEGGPERALRHVQDRAEQLSEPRPEYGHATNAVCVVGRRGLTKGLFMDRRAFLVSYDATQDANDEGLARLLGAVVPVCAGINLEYYFSFVDNERYGCGTKLPHNITGLVGVMNGPESDLRTGLPLQMVEIHEPVRILFVVESTPERVAPVFKANPQLSEFLENRWIRLATLDPETGVVHVRRGSKFELLDVAPSQLPTAGNSFGWFGSQLRHLPLAHITGTGWQPRA